MVGIIAVHQDDVVPTNYEYSICFDMLRQQGLRTEVIEEPLTGSVLNKFCAVLLGEAHSMLKRYEIEALNQ